MRIITKMKKKREILKMYLYELHSHTREVSRCASVPAKELPGIYKAMGFAGIVITDHFLNSNTTVPKDMEWEKRVDMFCRGYETAKEEGDKTGIDVMFGWEYRYLDVDFLTYGLDKKWLMENPDCMRWGLLQYCDEVRAAGGTVIHAHPFREAPYIQMLELVPEHINGAEVLNANRTDHENAMAEKYAKSCGLAQSAGTDNHAGKVGRYCAVGFERKAVNERDLMDMLINGEGILRDIKL